MLGLRACEVVAAWPGHRGMLLRVRIRGDVGWAASASVTGSRGRENPGALRAPMPISGPQSSASRAKACRYWSIRRRERAAGRPRQAPRRAHRRAARARGVPSSSVSICRARRVADAHRLVPQIRDVVAVRGLPPRQRARHRPRADGASTRRGGATCSSARPAVNASASRSSIGRDGHARRRARRARAATSVASSTGTAPGERRDQPLLQRVHRVARVAARERLPSAAARISAVDADTCIPDIRSRRQRKAGRRVGAGDEALPIAAQRGRSRDTARASGGRGRRPSAARRARARRCSSSPPRPRRRTRARGGRRGRRTRGNTRDRWERRDRRERAALSVSLRDPREFRAQRRRRTPRWSCRAGASSAASARAASSRARGSAMPSTWKCRMSHVARRTWQPGNVL